ncbi:hypothetical protein ACFL3T_03530 [Patescibacteria group bacterium]
MVIKIELKFADTVITPDGTCPECGYELSEEEIRDGWRDDPMDWTTKCPKCRHRFVAHLILTEQEDDVKKEVGRVEYLCLLQLFAGLKAARRGKSKILGKVYLYEKHPTLLWNCIRHFGTYEMALAAFKRR